MISFFAFSATMTTNSDLRLALGKSSSSWLQQLQKRIGGTPRSPGNWETGQNKTVPEYFLALPRSLPCQTERSVRRMALGFRTSDGIALQKKKRTVSRISLRI